MDKYDDFISDFYKAATGTRPGRAYCEAFGKMTEEEQDAEVASLQQMIDWEEAEEAFAQARLAQQWEDQVQKVIDSGAGDRVVAIRWIISALPKNDREYGAGYVAYCHHFPKSAEAEIKPFCYGRD